MPKKVGFKAGTNCVGFAWSPADIDQRAPFVQSINPRLIRSALNSFLGKLIPVTAYGHTLFAKKSRLPRDVSNKLPIKARTHVKLYFAKFSPTDSELRWAEPAASQAKSMKSRIFDRSQGNQA